MTFAQRLFERGMQGSGRRVGTIFEILCQQAFILFDDLVDKGPVSAGHGFKIGIAGIVFEHFDDIGRTVGRQIEQHALLAETLANIGNEPRQIEVFGIDLVDDDHPAQLAVGRITHHALGHEFDAALGIDDNQRCIDTRQRCNRLTGKIRVARGVDQVNMCVFVAKIDDGRRQGVTSLFLLNIEIGDRVAFLDTALGADGAGREQQGLGEAGLAGGTMANQRNRT